MRFNRQPVMAGVGVESFLLQAAVSKIRDQRKRKSTSCLLLMITYVEITCGGYMPSRLLKVNRGSCYFNFSLNSLSVKLTNNSMKS